MTGHESNLAALARSSGGAPPVPRPPYRWKTRVLVPAAMIIGVLLLLGYAGRRALTPALEVRVTPVVVKSGVGTAATGSSVQAPGWVEAAPFAMNVSALADGVVREVLVLEGEAVEAGQVIARMIDDDARLSLARAEADVHERSGDLDEARAMLVAAQTDWDNPVERTMELAVAEAVLAEAMAELDKGIADEAAAAARLDELNDEVQRKAPLVEPGAVSSGEFARLQLRRRQQQAAHAAATAERQKLESEVDHHRAELVAARERFRLRVMERLALAAARAGVQKAEAAHRNAQVARDEASLRLERMEIRSPAQGIVLTRLIEPGSRLMLGGNEMDSALALRLYDPARLQVRVDIPLVDAAKVGVGQTAEVSTEAAPDEMFRGRVARLVHEADIQKNTVQVKVDIESPNQRLRPEMLARVRIFGATGGSGGEAQRVYAPAEALSSMSGTHAQAWVVDQSTMSASMRHLVVGGARSDGWVEVVDGLRPGDRLITGNPPGLREGKRIRVIEDSATGGTP